MMKSVVDKPVRDELVARINSLSQSSTAQWGKMNVRQMIKHCMMWDDMAQGKTTYKRVFIGRIFGRVALKTILKDDAPLRRSTPTIPAFIITDTAGDISTEKSNWISHIEQYEHLNGSNFIHPFFGEMTKEQIGYMAYKHIDHHLRQFGV